MSEFRRRLMMAQRSGHIISEIKMPLGSYMDTGYKPNNTTRVECGVTPMSKSYYGVLFKGNTSNNSNQYGIQYSGEVVNLFVSCDESVQSGTSEKSINLIPTNHYDIVYSQDTLTVNGVSYEMTKSGTFQSGRNLYINADPDEVGLETENIWDYFKIYDNGVLVRDYVPYQKSNGTYGMLDKVNGVFYQSANSIPFDGNLITLPTGFTRLNYITCTSAQRFDCDFIPDNKTNFFVKCKSYGNSNFKFILSSKANNSSRRLELLNGNQGGSPNSALAFGYNNGANVVYIDNGNINFSFVKSENYLYIFKDGEYDQYTSRSRATFTCPKKLTIGSDNSNGNHTTYYEGDFQEIIIFGKAHYIPALNYNNVAGMYDVMNGVFKVSETSTPFVAGTVYGQ